MTEPRFLIAVTEHDANRYAVKCLESILVQSYPRDQWRVHWHDDCSNDGTTELIEGEIEALTFRSQQADGPRSVAFFAHSKRLGAMARWLELIKSADDDEIVVMVDGDDWLHGTDVLTRLAAVYADPECWLTYGSAKWFPEGVWDGRGRYPATVDEAGTFRGELFRWFHLRTVRARLAKKLPPLYLLNERGVHPMTASDIYLGLALLKMAGERYRFIGDQLYTYNYETLWNDAKVNREAQIREDRYARSLTPLARLDSLDDEPRRVDGRAP